MTGVGVVMVLGAGLIAAAPSAEGETGRARGKFEDAKVVTYRGLRLEVPASWRVHDLEKNPHTCVRLDKEAVYLGIPGPDQDCPAHAVGRTETISVQPGAGGAATSAGLAPGAEPSLDTLASTPEEARFALTGAGLSVTASYRDRPELIQTILSRARYSGPRRETSPPDAGGPQSSLGDAATEPLYATTTRIPRGGTATRYRGRGFDTCAAPSVSTMRAWRDSPHGAVGIYIGGVNRACPDGNLSRSWVTDVTRQGWKLLPIYVGRQAPCAFQRDLGRIRSDNVRAQARSAAENAVRRAKNFGLRPGSAIYYDMEAYNDTNSTCNRIVLRFLSAWTARLHQLGYLSGVYSSASSGIKQLSRHYRSSTYVRPDAIWFARWDGDRTVWDEPYVGDSKWRIWQRAKQYRGPHRETHGGRRINIDSNIIRGPVASARYVHRVTSSTGLNARSGPSTSYRVVRSWAPGATLRVLCQTRGQRISGTRVWDRLADGSYVTDAYVNTGSGWSSRITRCMYPYQVRADSLRIRTGPGTQYASRGSLPRGGLAWTVCQGRGQRIGESRVWDKIRNGRWVSDWYVTSPGRPGFTSTIPRCP